jgi:hypothetical protein
MDREEIQIQLDEAEQRLTSSLMSLAFPLATAVGMLGLSGAFPLPSSAMFGTTGAVALSSFLYKLNKYRERRLERNRLRDLLNTQLDGDAEEFVRQNPMAQIALDEARNTITIRNPDGSTMVGIKERPTVQVAEELPSEPAAAGAGTGLPRATMRHIQDLPRSVGGYARNGAYSGESKSDN